jgi:hypothetical protein
VVHIAIRTTEEILVARYWIDLKKNGHGVRAETYTRDKGIGSRLDVELAQFDVGTESVWFPVAGTLKTYVRRVHSDIEKTHEPVSIHKISILQDTLEFNKHPDPRVFTITHSPGTDISDRLKKVQYEFGQQKISNRPTKAEAEGMLREQLKRADEQKRQLVALPPEESSWVALMPWALGALLAVALLILRVTRHGR